MSYATIADYDRYGDGLVPAEQLDRALDRASDQVDCLTYNRIRKIGYDQLTPFQQNNIKKSVCQQADFIFQYGDFLVFPLGGYSAGSVSVSFKAVQGGGGVQTTETVINLLASTGLTSRRIC